MTSNDLPEGVIDAEPPGSWESASVDDGETQEQNADAVGSAALSTAAHDAASDDEAAGVDVGDVPEAPVEADAPIESARLEAEMDPDLSTENPDDFEKEHS